MLAVVVLQIALGGWVSTNYAVLACNEFPTCQGSWWPHMEFRDGFTLWRELGMTAGGEHIGFGALTAIHYTHRLAAYFVLGLLAWLAWRLRHVHALRAQSRWIAGLAAWQFATGLTNVVLDWLVFKDAQGAESKVELQVPVSAQAPGAAGGHGMGMKWPPGLAPLDVPTLAMPVMRPTLPSRLMMGFMAGLRWIEKNYRTATIADLRIVQCECYVVSFL